MANTGGELLPAHHTPTPLRGREWILEDLGAWFHHGGQRAILIGSPGIGKSRVAIALGETIAGTVLLDFAAASHPFQIVEQARTLGPDKGLPRLLLLDAIECAPPEIWDSPLLEHSYPGVPKIFIFRPGMHFETLQTPGTQVFTIDPNHPLHQADLEAYLELEGVPGCCDFISTFREAEFLIANRAQGANQLEGYYLGLWRDATRSYQGPLRIVIEQVALLLAGAPESLSIEAITDFTGLPTVLIREAIDELAPLLVMTGPTISLFSPGFARHIARHFSRDLGPVHGRIVSYFRETYPSWQEMHDAYGWRHLVLHCDRLARASRRQDFSVLHWLNEGSFSQLKLERTGMLPSVLSDLRLSLLAAIETEDIPRIVAFGLRIARLRKHESVKTAHRLADAGKLLLARENAQLVSHEGQRFLLWILFASQTLEDGDLDVTASVLKEAFTYPVSALSDSEIRLAASLLATMTSLLAPNSPLRPALFQALTMQHEPRSACVAYKTASSCFILPRPIRLEFLEKAGTYAEQIKNPDERQSFQREIATRKGRLSGHAEPNVAYPDRLEKATLCDEEFERMLKELASGALSPATVAASLIPIKDASWLATAFGKLLDHLTSHPIDEDLLQHGLMSFLQSLEDAHIKEIPPRLLDSISLAILSFDKAVDRSRFLARFAVLLASKERPLEAQQRISLSAANAFSITDPATRAEALLYLASQVAATGALGRARDLTFHAVELGARVADLDRECRQLVRLLATSTTKTDSAEEILRLGESLRFDNSAPELEAKGRALVALAAGLDRLGAEAQARAYRQKAIEAAEAIDNIELRIHLLCDLAAALHGSGEKRQARKLAKQARALHDHEASVLGLTATTGLLRAAMALENSTQIKKAFDLCLNRLSPETFDTWLSTPSFLEFLSLTHRLGRTDELAPFLNSAREQPHLEDRELLGLLRAELELSRYTAAEAILSRLSTVDARCQAGVDLALALLPYNAESSLKHVMAIPLENSRTDGIRRLALLNSCDIRPTEQPRVRRVLYELTLLAVDHPDAMDSVLSRWIQGCPHQDIVLAISDKMGWSLHPTPARETPTQASTSSNRAVSNFLDPQSTDLKPSQAADTPDHDSGIMLNDQGFQAISLTKPRS